VTLHLRDSVTYETRFHRCQMVIEDLAGGSRIQPHAAALAYQQRNQPEVAGLTSARPNRLKSPLRRCAPRH